MRILFYTYFINLSFGIRTALFTIRKRIHPPVQRPEKIGNFDQPRAFLCIVYLILNMVIPVNKRRFPTLFCICLILSILLAFRIIYSIKHFNEVYDNRAYIVAYFSLFIYLFIVTIISFLDYMKTVFDKNASLTVTAYGINDNLSIFSVGDINWSEIIDIKISNALNTDFLIIIVKDPQSFINRKNRLKQRPLKSFLKRFGSPIAISQKRIDYNLTELKDVLTRAMHK